jgi:hypothetical protein
MRKPMFIAATLFIAGTAFATEKPGTDGTATAWESGAKVLLVEKCDKGASGDWDYSACVRVLRERVPGILCKRGAGVYKWSFQVGAEKSKLDQSTTCKGG